MTDLQEKFIEFCKTEDPPFNPTDQQKRAIFDSVNIVSAGAGSGKTAVLSHRFVYLVMSGIHSDEILTITFTKDATASMKKKIYSLLKKAVDCEYIDAEELDRFSSSTISTTDGLCTEIAKSGCINYGLSPDFKIEKDSELEVYAEDLADRILSEYKTDSRLKTWLSCWSVDNIKEFFKVLAENHISISRNIDFRAYENLVLNRYSQDCDMDFLEETVTSFIDYIKSMDKPSSTMMVNLAIAENFITRKDYESLAGLQNFSMSASNEAKSKMNSIKEYAGKCMYIHRDSLDLLDLIILVCNDLQIALQKHKRETGLVTYHDVLLLAIDVLKTNNEIKRYYSEKFKAIMVDEFQDNNADNKELVYLLADGKNEKIFMVGDEKQSIYRFRNADVRVFKNMQLDFGSDHNEKLQHNYRSEGGLIEFINNTFATVFKDAAKDFEASYTDLIASKNRVDSHVRILVNSPDNESITTEAEAFNIAKNIFDILNGKNSDYLIPEGDGVRQPKPEDIAILLKVSTHQIYYEKALQAYGIPYEAVESKSMTVDAVANDIYNLLQLVVWGKQDGIAKYALLKSPLCNGDENELDYLVNEVRRHIQNNTIADTISYIWNELGYRFFLLRREQNHKYSEYYDYLFAVAVAFDKDEKTVVDFLDYIRPMLGEECKIKDIEIQRERESGVKIMSIHKSKGLEFPIVIVPDMQSGSRSPGGFKPEIYLENSVVSFPYVRLFEKKGKSCKLMNPVVDKELENLYELAETKRVLYVAATRAQHHLIFSGIVKSTSTVKSMFSLLLGAVDKNMYEYYDSSALSGCLKKEEYDGKIQADYSVTYDFKFTKLTNAITSLDDVNTKFDKPLKAYECDAFIQSSTDFGTYVHSLLEKTVNGSDCSNDYGLFVDDPHRDIIKRDANLMKDTFINSTFFSRFADYEKQTEKGFFYCDGDSEVLEGVIDLLCVGKDEIVIIDYKTDKYMDPDTHKNQMEIYKKAMADYYKKPTTAYLFYLRSGEVFKY